MTDRKTKLLFLHDYLLKHSDENHPLTKDDIRLAYEEHGFSGNTNTIPRDIESLIEYGDEILTSSQRPVSYYIASRHFTLSEIRMLKDSLASAQFITKEQTQNLGRKLAAMAGEHSQTMLVTGVSVAKTENTQVPDIVITLCQAINLGKKVTFQYIDYLPNRQKTLRHGGSFYSFSPYDLLCDNSRYYVIGWHEKRKLIGPFRLDMMTNVRMLDEAAMPAPEDYDPSVYGYKVMHMYDGDEVEVTLECCNCMMLQLFDHYGDNFKSEVKDDKHFIAWVTASISNTFFAWVAQYGGKIRIISPEDIRQRYLRFGRIIAEEQQ